MTELEIYGQIDCTIPPELLARYGHLSYAEMAEVPALAPWAAQLRRADEEWENAIAQAAAED